MLSWELSLELGLLLGPVGICLVLALLGLLNGNCELMKLKCEQAPTLGRALASGGWLAGPAIFGYGYSPT